MSQSLIEYSTSESIKDSAKELKTNAETIISKIGDIENEIEHIAQDEQNAIQDICNIIIGECKEIIEQGDHIVSEINDIEDYEEPVDEFLPEPANSIRHTSITWEAKDFRDIEIMETLDKLFYKGMTDVQILKLLEASL